MNLLTVSLHKRSYSLVLFIYIIERLVLSNYRSREIALKNEAITLTLGIFFHVTVLLQFRFSFRTTTQLPAKSCIKLLKLYRQFNSKKKFTYKHSIWTHTHTHTTWLELVFSSHWHCRLETENDTEHGFLWSVFGWPQISWTWEEDSSVMENRSRLIFRFCSFTGN